MNEESQSREEFETWLNQIHPNGKSLSNSLDLPQKVIAESAWADAWQASRKAAPEGIEAGFHCEPQPAVTDDGFCEWVCPKPVGYLMQCCDCGLIHEVETRVAKYQPHPSEDFTVVEDPDLQTQWRMKRRDDLAGS